MITSEFQLKKINEFIIDAKQLKNKTNEIIESIDISLSTQMWGDAVDTFFQRVISYYPLDFDHIKLTVNRDMLITLHISEYTNRYLTLLDIFIENLEKKKEEIKMELSNSAKSKEGIKDIEGFKSTIQKEKGLNMSKEIFISHSSKNRDIIDELVGFMQNTLNITKDKIFCSSYSGTLKYGEAFIPQIKDNIIGCKLVILLVSTEFLSSPFCMAELGAVWALNQNIFPIIIPPVTIEQYNQTPLMGIQALSLTDSNVANTLIKKMVGCGLVDLDNITFGDFSDFNKKINEITMFLKQDSEGYYITKIKDVRKVPDDYKCYLIEGLLKIDSCPVNGETHWLFFNSGEFGELRRGDMIRFKPKDKGMPAPLRDFSDVKNTRNIYVSKLEVLNSTTTNI